MRPYAHFLQREMKIPASFLVAGWALVALLPFPANAETDNPSVVPMQLRLAYAGSTGMVVSWNTFSRLSKPTVRYGRSPKALDHIASSEVSVTYPTSTTYNNHVKITGLEPNTEYYYMPDHGKDPRSFRTSRPSGDYTPYTVAYVADMGLMGPDGLTTHVGTGAANPLGPHDKNTIQSLEENIPHFDFLWHGKLIHIVRATSC